MAVSGGFLEVRPDQVTILAQAAETSEQIDVERAKRAKERAEERLRAQNQDNIDFKRAELALKRAINRISVAEKNYNCFQTPFGFATKPGVFLLY